MLVARSFKYSSSPPSTSTFDEKPTPKDHARRPHSNHGVNSERKQTTSRTSMPTRPSPPVKSTTEPMRIPTKPVDVPVPDRTRASGTRTMGASKSRAPCANRRKQSMPEKHRADAIPPSVAALLAMTTIPRPKPSQFKRRTSSSRSMSIDELVNEWKSDDSPGRSFGSSPSLHVLLEDLDELDPRSASSPEVGQESREYLHTRSTSSDSVPSLEADDRSLLSLGSPSTPGSLHSRRSSSNLRKDLPRSQPARGEDCGSNHPLVSLPASDEEEEDLVMPNSRSRASTPKPKFSFKSNLTTSLQALKSAALSSLSSLKSLPAPPSRDRRLLPGAGASPMADDMLWSHPFLFPRFSPEVRPDIRGTPTEAQRRYLNPTPLTFEEQEAPFQQALHAPFLEEELGDVPTIQLQTYSRGKGRNRSKRSESPDPNSEAGRALAGAATARQREPRENSDFLRVVVLEMNMRREGKLEMGRARIWLPPRQEVEYEQSRIGSKKVPRRWVGVSAD